MSKRGAFNGGNIRAGSGRIPVLTILFAVLMIFLAPQGIPLTVEQTPPPFPYPTSMTLTATPQLIPINGSTATITPTVYFSDGKTYPYLCEFRNPTNLGTLSSTWGQSVTLTSGMTEGIETVEAWPRNYPSLKKTVQVQFTREDTAPPSVSNPSASPSVILNENGRGRPAGTSAAQLTVTVTDDAGVDTVTIDLSPIGGSATAPMTLISGTNINGVWSVTTSATTGINATHALLVTATDFYGRYNTAVSVQLEVRRRGDVVRDNVVDMKDAVYIAYYTVGREPESSNPPTAFIANVVGNAGDPGGDGKIDMKDALYIARWATDLEPVAP